MSDPTPALSSFLPTAVRGRGVVGRAGDGELGECLEAYAERILDGEVSGILKQTDRRLVFRDGDHVVKVVFLGTLHRKRKWRRYGLSEARNLEHAARLGLVVPGVFAQGRVRRRFDPLVASLLVIEHLAGRSSLSSQLAIAGDHVQRRRVLDRVAGVLVDLLRTGCFHVDVGPDNVFLPCHGSRVISPAVIDLEYAEFVVPGQVSQLARQSSRLARYCRRDWPELDYCRWFDGVLESARVVCGIDVSACERARSEFASQLERSSLSRESADLFRAA